MLAKLGLALVAAASIALSGCSEPEPIRLGFVAGLSGRVADLGAEGRNGALLAVEARNKRGGVRGRRVELIAEDDQQDAERAQQAVTRLIDRKVAAIVGPMTSAMATATVPLVNAAQIVMISPTVTTNSLSGIDDYFFRVLASTRSFARKSADYHYQQLGLRRVVAIPDQSNAAYTESWLADYRAAFSAAGGRVEARVDFSSSSTTRFDQLAQRALATKPDAVLILANSVDAAMIAQHLRILSPAVVITASEWAATEQLIEIGGRAVDRVVIAQFLDRQSSEPSYVAFRDSYVARFGRQPGFAGLTAFDAANIVLDAIAQQENNQALKQVLLAQKRFAGAQSPVVFDAFGDTSRENHLTIIKDGSFAVLR